MYHVLFQPITDEVEIKQIDNETVGVVEQGADITEFTESVEWDLMSVYSHRHVRWYPCCDYPSVMNSLVFLWVLSRMKVETQPYSVYSFLLENWL